MQSMCTVGILYLCVCVCVCVVLCCVVLCVCVCVCVCVHVGVNLRAVGVLDGRSCSTSRIAQSKASDGQVYLLLTINRV